MGEVGGREEEGGWGGGRVEGGGKYMVLLYCREYTQRMPESVGEDTKIHIGHNCPSQMCYSLTRIATMHYRAALIIPHPSHLGAQVVLEGPVVLHFLSRGHPGAPGGRDFQGDLEGLDLQM